MDESTDRMGTAKSVFIYSLLTRLMCLLSRAFENNAAKVSLGIGISSELHEKNEELVAEYKSVFQSICQSDVASW